jgi:hypothetical protein
MRTREPAFLAVLSACLAACLGPARATLLAYEPFLAGGASANPAAGQYTNAVPYPADQLLGQGPAAMGFSTGSTWTNNSGSGYNASVYYRTEAGQGGYTDGSGYQLVTAAGQLNLQRNSGTSSDSDKNAVRTLALGGNLPGVMYISFLASMTAGDHVRLSSGATDGSSTQRFFFGASTTRNPFVTGWTGSAYTNVVNSGIAITTNTMHLFVARIRDNGDAVNDEIALYLDPSLASEGLNTPAAELTLGNFYVANDAGWTLVDAYIRGRAIDTPSSVLVDEIRIGTTWADVTPYTVPEPGTFGALLLGLALARQYVLRTR